mgnify:CR=1 FL=1
MIYKNEKCRIMSKKEDEKCKIITNVYWFDYQKMVY